MWMPVHVPAAPLPTQLPDNGLENVVKDGPSPWVLITCVGKHIELLDSGFGLAQLVVTIT